MSIRSYRVNFRERWGVDTELWNTFWRNLELDLQDFGPREFYLGCSGFVSDYGVSVSGVAGKETSGD